MRYLLNLIVWFVSFVTFFISCSHGWDLHGTIFWGVLFLASNGRMNQMDLEEKI